MIPTISKKEKSQSIMANQFRVALIGCGAIAGNHVKGIQSAGQSICALCDIDPAQANRLATKYALGPVPVYTQWKELLEKERPHAIHICTPHHLHAEMCIEALQKNIHVLCEKPLAISMEQLEHIQKAASLSKAQLGVCLQNRYEANLIRAKELAGEEGVAAAFGDVVWKRNADYYDSASWRGTQKEEGGGVMINQALHTLDLLLWLCGMPTHVVAHVSNDHLQGKIEVEDTATGRFELPDGRIFNIYATTAAGESFTAHIRLRFPSKKVLHVETNMMAYDGKPLEIGERGEAMGKSVWGVGHVALIRDFYRHIGEGTPFPIDAVEGGKVIKLILSMYASHGNRLEVLS